MEETVVIKAPKEAKDFFERILHKKREHQKEVREKFLKETTKN